MIRWAAGCESPARQSVGTIHGRIRGCAGRGLGVRARARAPRARAGLLSADTMDGLLVCTLGSLCHEVVFFLSQFYSPAQRVDVYCNRSGSWHTHTPTPVPHTHRPRIPRSRKSASAPLDHRCQLLRHATSRGSAPARRGRRCAAARPHGCTSARPICSTGCSGAARAANGLLLAAPRPRPRPPTL